MRFVKGHGTGNDFVVLPDVDDRLALTPELVTALCDRHRGIGGDGVLRVVRVDGDWFMDYRNADGSLAEMCGNGVRVYARYLVSAGLAPPGPVPIVTRAGRVSADVSGDVITVDMGLPKVLGPARAVAGGVAYAGTAVDCGNPHLVCPVADLSTLDLSRAPEVDPAEFPDGVNVSFYTGSAPSVATRVYERGSGETLSCGSGALAVAAVALGGGPGRVAVDVPGGRLVATFDPGTAYLAGPAVLVAEGEWTG
jgi:diaminopimelate epimerase